MIECEFVEHIIAPGVILGLQMIKSFINDLITKRFDSEMIVFFEQSLTRLSRL